MMSSILREAVLMDSMVSTTWATAWPPRTATSDADAASSLARRAFSAFWFTVAGQLLHGLGGFLQGAGLHFGALGQVGITGRDFTAGHENGVGATCAPADTMPIRLCIHVLEGLLQLTHLVAAN